MKATVVLALLLLTFVAQADVILEDTPPSRPPRKKAVKTHTTVTATTTTAATTTAGTTAATTSTAITETAAPPATQTTASQAPAVPAPAPEPRKSKLPSGAITTVGIVLIVALAANRRRARKAE